MIRCLDFFLVLEEAHAVALEGHVFLIFLLGFDAEGGLSRFAASH